MNERNITIRCLVIAGITLAAAAQTARAALLAQDEFSYAIGSQIVGQGSNSNWPTAGKTWTGATTAILETGDLVYSK
ncbi:MAG: hypothetical protein WCG03_11330 [Kiritimatiellales bacterium]